VFGAISGRSSFAVTQETAMSHQSCEFGPRVSIRAFECTAGQTLLILSSLANWP
jgi:hypothetical protein